MEELSLPPSPDIALMMHLANDTTIFIIPFQPPSPVECQTFAPSICCMRIIIRTKKIVRLFLLSIIGLWLQQQQNRRFLSLPLKPLFSINRNSARRQKRRLPLSPSHLFLLFLNFLSHGQIFCEYCCVRSTRLYPDLARLLGWQVCYGLYFHTFLSLKP